MLLSCYIQVQIHTGLLIYWFFRNPFGVQITIFARKAQLVPMCLFFWKSVTIYLTRSEPDTSMNITQVRRFSVVVTDSGCGSSKTCISKLFTLTCKCNPCTSLNGNFSIHLLIKITSLQVHAVKM